MGLRGSGGHGDVPREVMDGKSTCWRGIREGGEGESEQRHSRKGCSQMLDHRQWGRMQCSHVVLTTIGANRGLLYFSSSETLDTENLMTTWCPCPWLGSQSFHCPHCRQCGDSARPWAGCTEGFALYEPTGTGVVLETTPGIRVSPHLSLLMENAWALDSCPPLLAIQHLPHGGFVAWIMSNRQMNLSKIREPTKTRWDIWVFSLPSPFPNNNLGSEHPWVLCAFMIKRKKKATDLFMAVFKVRQMEARKISPAPTWSTICGLGQRRDSQPQGHSTCGGSFPHGQSFLLPLLDLCQRIACTPHPTSWGSLCFSEAGATHAWDVIWGDITTSLWYQQGLYLTTIVMRLRKAAIIQPLILNGNVWSGSRVKSQHPVSCFSDHPPRPGNCCSL